MEDSKRDAQTALDSVFKLRVSDCELHVCVASYMGHKETPVFQRLQLSTELKAEFGDVVTKFLDKWREEHEEQQLPLWPHQDGTTPEPYEFEYVDLEGQEQIKEQIEGLAGPFISLPVFTADDEVVSGIRFYAITLVPRTGSPVHFFRLYTPKKELSRSVWFIAFLHDGQFDHSKTPTFLFDSHIDCFSTGRHLFVVQKTNFQGIFKFLEVVVETATETLEIIRKTIPIHNFEQFAEDCRAHVQKLAKLNNIARKPYLNTITMDDIRDVIRQVPSLAIRIERVGDTEMLVYDRTDRWAILRLLDNHFMQSLLTKGIYDANSSRLISGTERRRKQRGK